MTSHRCSWAQRSVIVCLFWGACASEESDARPGAPRMVGDMATATNGGPIPDSKPATADADAGPGVESSGQGGATVRDAGPLRPSFPAAGDFAVAGIFPTLNEPTDADCTVYRPAVLGDEGRLHPVILWGNGTGAVTVTLYAGFLEHWASHGFIVAAAHATNAGSGEAMLACLGWIEAENARAGSPYEGHVDLGNVGASGHSQGGGGAVMVGRDVRVRATLPLQAWTGAPAHVAGAEMHQTGPMFLVSGDADLIAPRDANQKPLFEGSNVPTVWATLAGGDHVTIALGNIAKYRAPTVAWFRLHLMGDATARGMFYGADCGLCTNPAWTVQRKHMD